MHFIYLIRASIWLVAAFVRAHFYFKKNAHSDLELPPTARLNSKERRRLQHYFYGTTYLSIIFGTLHGHRRTAREKNLYSNLAALAYFFDDLADEFRRRDDTEIDWKNNPEDYGHLADDERKLSLHFLQNVYRQLPPTDLEQFKTFMHRVFNVEASGRQATDKPLAFNDLEKITTEKGGYSVLLFRRILAHPMSAAEQEAIFQFGFLIQLCDDIFDIWFDEKEGVQTLPIHFSKAVRVADLQQFFERQVAVVNRSFRQSGLPDVQVETSLRVIHFIVAITRVCLRHYFFLEKKLEKLPLADRQQMVVDMERWSNRWLAFRELLRPID